MTDVPAIETHRLVKRFGNIEALKGVDMRVERGEFFGLLGPNGAGKTTLIRILTTLLRPTSGEARVCGHHVVRECAKVRHLIGVVPQAMTCDLDLTARENLDIYGRFYGLSKRERTEQIDYLLRMIGLEQRSDDLVATYSGGMRRRLEVARALIHRPAVLILDEPTLGLDPQSRYMVWKLLKRLKERYSLTILLTTHYMEEAEALCTRVAIIDYGRIIAVDTVEGLKKSVHEKDRVELTVECPQGVDPVATVRTLKKVKSAVYKEGLLTATVENSQQELPLIFEALYAKGVNIKNARITSLTLEDVFIHYTGRPVRDEETRKVSFFIGAGVPRKWGR